MKYTLLAIVVACVVIFVASGCAVYYPTSYRAFIPRILDSEYKEYQRLCKEEIGKVVYAREIKLTENTKLFWEFRKIKLGKFIEMKLMGTITRINKDYNTDRISYLYVGGFKYYTGWTQKSFSMHDDVEQYIRCQPLLYGKTWKEEFAIIEKIALDNKESIGEEYVEKFQEYSQYHYESKSNDIYRQLVNFKQLKESK